MIAWRFGDLATNRLSDPGQLSNIILAALAGSEVPQAFATEVAGISRVGPYWALPGPRHEKIAESEIYFRGDESAVEESLNSRHLEDYDTSLRLAPLDRALATGIASISLVRMQLSKHGEFRPFSFRLSATEYEAEPAVWPVILTFSRYRGPQDDFGPHFRVEPQSNDQGAPDTRSFEFYALL
ncbi:hypothetical protein [Devosia sp.]|uniref:hypothetical protein n=1 Tax=Devosia sp. TaxID=1871048 RepID=UPI003F712996